VSETAAVRLDVWLWAARFFKTRSLAKQAIESGKVEVDDAGAKPAKAIRPGDRVRVMRGDDRLDCEVLELAEKRGSAIDAAKLYRETPASIAARERLQDERRLAAPLPAPGGRPTKRDRRRMDRWRRTD
jgi:ribosome-associated heat shock protein Hsp15